MARSTDSSSDSRVGAFLCGEAHGLPIGIAKRVSHIRQGSLNDRS